MKTLSDLKKIMIVCGILISTLLSSNNTMGEIRIPYILSSNMVLQRDMETNIWGWANNGEKITVSFRDGVYKTKAEKDGRWIVKVPTGKAGGPFEMVISGNNTITLSNILIGDVWVCSGQSNMEFQLRGAEKGDYEAKKANYKNIRLFQVQKNPSVVPLDNTGESQWTECTSLTAADFSAIGYFFGKKIHTETGVPIGLISSNWGGTIIETWTSNEGNSKDSITSEWLKGTKNYDARAMAAKLKIIFDNYQIELKKVQNPDWTHKYISPDYDDNNWDKINQPGLWESKEGYESFDGVMWLRKSFIIPQGFDLNKARLSLCMIDDSDITWVNGKRIGETFNMYNVSRNYEISSNVLKYGKNQIVVRVEDYVGGGGIYGIPEDLNLSDGINAIDLTGEWKIQKDELPVPPNPVTLSESALQPNQYPTLLYNGMINPLINFGIKGVIWYQGESNADALFQAKRYENQIKVLINDWRNKWKIGDFYFYQVQLANYRAETSKPTNEIWPYLREAQSKALELPNTGMACIIDIGDAGDIHPKNKIDVGERLALNALRDQFGKIILSNGPRFSEAKIESNRAIITFSGVGAGLKSTNKYGYINGFAVAGADKVFHYAKASFNSTNSLVVYSEKVEKIEAVRFLWADNPGEINLYNSVGLPAEPFRTDNW